MTQPASLPRCTACDSPVAPADERCATCGSPLAQPVRRVVVLLFADLAGYTAWCSTQDPEDVHLLVRPLMNALRRVCESLDGAVTTIEGDGLMAVFGAHGSDEAAVHKAVLAAARLQALVEDRQVALQGGLPGLKVGLHAGEVLVAPSWEASGFSVAGDAVNLARRICEAAPVGSVLAHEVLATDEAWGPVQRITVKGHSVPVPVRTLDRAQVPGPRGLSTTPFVGRDALLHEIDGAVERGPVVLVGEPGAGKSRLAGAWAQSRGLRGLVVRCPSFSADGPWAGLKELAAALLPQADDAHLRALRRIAGETVDSNEPDTEEALVAALAAEVGRLGDAVLLVDDAHDASRPVLRLIDAVTGVPVVAAARRRPEGLAGQEVVVPPLDEDETDLLVSALLPAADDEVRALLRQRCGGVPLFVEQCARLLVDERLVEVAGSTLRLVPGASLRVVPTTMRLFVAARLDALPADERRVLAAASVIGDEVDLDLLRHLLGQDPADPVERLVERALLLWEAADEGRPRLRFAHALVRDVAYDGQLRSDRVSWHLVAAEWYAVLPVSSVLEAQAQHLEAAVRLGRPDCDLVRRTVDAMVLHARSICEERPSDAGDVLDRAAALVLAHPSCEIDTLVLQLVRLSALNSLGREVEAAELSEIVVAECASDDLRAEALLQRGRALATSRPQDAAAALDDASVLFARLGDVASVAEVDLHRAIVAERDGGLGAFVEANRRAFETALRAGDARLQSHAAHDLAMHAFVDGRAALDQWAPVARRLQRQDDRVGPARLAAAEAGVALYARDDVAAVELGVRAQQLGHRAGLAHAVSNGMLGECEALVLLGRLAEAERRIADAHERARTRVSKVFDFNVTLVELALRRRQGSLDEAEAVRRDLQARVEQQGSFAGADLDERLALDLLERGDYTAARQRADAAMAAHRGMGHQFPALRISVTAAAATVSGRGRMTLGEVGDARREARERGAPQVEALLARWWDLDDALQGHAAFPRDVPPSDLAEARALELDAAGLREDPDALLEAARVWSSLGTTVFWARSLLWHEALTGAVHGQAQEVLRAVGAPPGFADRTRAQVPG